MKTGITHSSKAGSCDLLVQILHNSAIISKDAMANETFLVAVIEDEGRDGRKTFRETIHFSAYALQEQLPIFLNFWVLCKHGYAYKGF